MKERINITIHPELRNKAQALMVHGHFSNFSEYIEQLIREDYRRQTNDYRALRAIQRGVAVLDKSKPPGA